MAHKLDSFPSFPSPPPAWQRRLPEDIYKDIVHYWELARGERKNFIAAVKERLYGFETRLRQQYMGIIAGSLGDPTTPRSRRAQVHRSSASSRALTKCEQESAVPPAPMSEKAMRLDKPQAGRHLSDVGLPDHPELWELPVPTQRFLADIINADRLSVHIQAEEIVAHLEQYPPSDRGMINYALAEVVVRLLKQGYHAKNPSLEAG